MLDFNLAYVAPEILLVLVAFVILLTGLYSPAFRRRGAGWIAALGILVAMVMEARLWGIDDTTFSQSFRADGFAVFFKEVFLVAAFLVVVSSFRFAEQRVKRASDFYALILFALTGMMLLASATEFITLYISLELMTISFFILVASIKTEARPAEAGLKYLILNAMSSALLLYGVSLLYGLTGTTYFNSISAAFSGDTAAILAGIALVLVLVGFGFKVSMVPFHMWAPDVYEGAPTPVSGFLATGSKAAGFAVLLRTFLVAFPGAEGFWATLVAVMAAVTMVLGNLIAVPQTSIKRLLAYSSVAQAGYLLVGLAAANHLGTTAVLFQALLYTFSTLAAFAVATIYGQASGSDEIEDYAGLSQRSPLLAVVMLLAMVSMAGVPPFAGFMGKFALFASAVDAEKTWLAALGLVISVVSIYYYFRVIKVMYVDAPRDTATVLQLSGSTRFALIIAGLGIVLLGLLPGPVMDWASAAAAVLR